MSRRPAPAWIARRGCSHHGLTATQRAVLLCLWDHADSRDAAFPGVPTIAAETGFSERAVKYALVELEARQFIVRRLDTQPVEPGRWKRKAVEWLLTATPGGVISSADAERKAS